jgi:hypothetical protein
VSQPVFVLSPYCCVLSGETINTHFIVFWFTLWGLKTHNLLHPNHYTSDAVSLDRNCFHNVVSEGGDMIIFSMSGVTCISSVWVERHVYLQSEWSEMSIFNLSGATCLSSVWVERHVYLQSEWSNMSIFSLSGATCLSSVWVERHVYLQSEWSDMSIFSLSGATCLSSVWVERHACRPTQTEDRHVAPLRLKIDMSLHSDWR